jgi:hypothetical protein
MGRGFSRTHDIRGSDRDEMMARKPLGCGVGYTWIAPDNNLGCWCRKVVMESGDDRESDGGSRARDTRNHDGQCDERGNGKQNGANAGRQRASQPWQVSYLLRRLLDAHWTSPAFDDECVDEIPSNDQILGKSLVRKSGTDVIIVKTGFSTGPPQKHGMKQLLTPPRPSTSCTRSRRVEHSVAKMRP